MSTDGYRRLIGPAVLLVVTGLFFHEAIRGDRLTLIWDVADYSYPVMAYIAYWYRQGIVPLWSHSLFNGYPLFADPQAQTFYPVNLLFAALTNFTPRIVYLQLIFHYFLAGLSMYVLCARLGHRWTASLVAAIAYMLSGYMVGHLSHILIYSAAWLPLLVVLLDDALARTRFRGAMIAGLALGVSILSGPLQTIFYTMVVLAVHAAFQIIRQYRAVRQPRVLLSSMGLFAVMVGAGVWVAMVQVLPTWEFIANTNRSEARSLVSAGLGIDWPYLITLVAPNYFGGITGPYWGKVDITQQSLYMGIAPLVFTVLACVSRRNAWTVYLGAGALVSLLISMGTHTPVFSLFYHGVPGFDYFRNALHFLFVFHFYIALLAAEGATALFEGNVSGKKLGIGVVAVCTAAAVLYAILPHPPDALTARRALQAVLGAGGFLAAAGVALFIVKMTRAALVAQVIVVGVLFADLWIVTGQSVTLGQRTAAGQLEKPTELVTMIKRDVGLAEEGGLYRGNPPDQSDDYLDRGLFRTYIKPEGRVYRVPDDQTLFGIVGFNRAILQGLSFVDGYSPVVLRRHQELADAVGTSALERYLQLSNVRYVVTIGETVNVARVGRVMPRAIVVGRAEVLGDSPAILSRLANPSFDPFTEAILEDAPRSEGDNGPVKSTLRFMGYTPNRIEMDVASDQTGYLVLNDAYYPGWQAFVDGVRTPVYRANYESKAIAFPAGSHRVVWKFSPTSFKNGLVLTAIALAALLGVLWFWKGTQGRVAEFQPRSVRRGRN